MKKYLLIAVALFSCNSDYQSAEQNRNETINDKCFIYPIEIDSLGIQDLYDSARWYIYTRYCDVLYRPKNDSLVSMPFGELELKFDNLFVRNDTAVFSFNFIYKGQPVLPSMMREYQQLATGIGFDTKTKSKIYEVFGNTTATYKGDPNSRYENPLQPEVLMYIKGNWDKLYDCFRGIAKRKGIKE